MSGNCYGCGCLSTEYEVYNDHGGSCVGFLCRRCEKTMVREGQTSSSLERHPDPFEKNNGYLNYSTANVALWLGNTEECTNDIGEATRTMDREAWKEFAIIALVKAGHAATIADCVVPMTPDGVGYRHPEVDWITLYHDVKEAWAEEDAYFITTLNSGEKAEQPLYAWHSETLWHTAKRHLCSGCGHESHIAAETEDEGEECGTVRCPACLSWHYFLI